MWCVDNTEKAGEFLSMNIIKRNGESYIFDVSKIVDAISKAVIRQEMKKAEKEISVIDFFKESTSSSIFARRIVRVGLLPFFTISMSVALS